MIRTKVTPSFNPYPLFDSSTTTNISSDGTQVFQLESYRAEELLFEHNPPYILTLPFEKILAKGKRAAKNKTPRPLNQYMIFRKDFEARYKLEHPNQRLSTTEYTRMATKAWRKLPEQTKRYFVYLQREGEKWHKRTYPNYKFSPKKNKKTKCKPGRKRNNVTTISNLSRPNRENNTTNNDNTNRNNANRNNDGETILSFNNFYPTTTTIPSTVLFNPTLDTTNLYPNFNTKTPRPPDNTFVDTLSTTALSPPLTPSDNGNSHGYSYGEHIENVINEVTNGNLGQQTKGSEWENFGYIDDLRKYMFGNMDNDMNHNLHADTDISSHLDNILVY
ncbi:10552_t:CDS:2 [Paraglomus brasilianum]|uniref:10552_t:CDS:1 n=1 Tax=Paraglomus brasilianum TaxID=144538 RepID=A0A9N9ATV6_9GLOM|nr:10552_t:CDS:2 [Paraglomus brasilianum]